MAFLAGEGIPPALKLAKGKKLRPYWREQLAELHSAYDGICAYLGVYVELCTGGNSVDHFTPKSKDILLAYEWDNYRLASSKVNAKKRDLTGILDPFNVVAGSFKLSFITGEIGPSVAGTPLSRLIRRTIKRLNLNRQDYCDLRMDWFTEYVNGHISDDYLRRKAPFIYFEANRQGLL